MSAQQLQFPLAILSWNLPPSMGYEAGTPIAMDFLVHNLDVLPREYSLHLKVEKDGELVEERTIAVDGHESFWIIKMSIRGLYVEETVEVTDATLSIQLLDVLTGEYVDSVSTLLYLPMGTLSWNLPPAMGYEAGAPIAVQLLVSNPTLLPREYSLHLKVEKDGELVEERTIAVDGHESFWIIKMSIRELYVEETVEVTDATLSMHLLDVATGEYVDSVSTLLYSGVWPPGTVTWEMALATFIGIIVFSFLAALVVGIARGE